VEVSKVIFGDCSSGYPYSIVKANTHYLYPVAHSVIHLQVTGMFSLTYKI